MTLSVSKISLRFLVFTFSFLVSLSAVRGGEGMWIPLLLKALNEAEMKAMGMKMNAEDIYSVNEGSLKDAIVHFGGFCTGEVISDQGLLLTNHHCGYDVIQGHSTLEQNYLTNGFWAANHKEEIPSPGLFATFIIRIEDVSEAVLKGVTDEMSLQERQSVVDKNMNTVRQETKRESYQDVMIRPFFEGNQYYLFVTETYNDVRYVGSPPESIGKFGADTDNWVWPRHTGDFALFRIYAGPDNKPAEYSPDNKPFKPRHFLPVSIDGVEEGDFTLVFGFPGRTNQYLPSVAVEQIAEIIDPARVGVRDISLGIMNKHMRENEAARLAYSSKFASLANSWKKWIGEMEGLREKNAVAEKAKEEADFMMRVKKDKALRKKYEDVLPQMNAIYEQLDPLVKPRTLLAELIGGYNIEAFRLAIYADRLVQAYKENGDAGFQSMAARVNGALDGFWKDYHQSIDEEVFGALIKHVRTNLAPEYMPFAFDKLNADPTSNPDEVLAGIIFATSDLVTEKGFNSQVSQGGEAFTKRMQIDPTYQTYLSIKKVLDENISPAYNALNDQLQPLQQKYMAGLMEAYPEQRFWPDANSTLRVTYGQVESYEPRDAVTYKTKTYLEGVMEKYVPGDYEFDVHPKLIDLYNRKDYGDYAENGKMPVCFIASNHTTGGNSGSPAIDAYGNLIGINFDRVWEGTMSDLYYDRSICRNIMVDVRYILFVIDKFAGAGHLVREMEVVRGK